MLAPPSSAGFGAGMRSSSPCWTSGAGGGCARLEAAAAEATASTPASPVRRPNRIHPTAAGSFSTEAGGSAAGRLPAASTSGMRRANTLSSPREASKITRDTSRASRPSA